MKPTQCMVKTIQSSCSNVSLLSPYHNMCTVSCIGYSTIIITISPSSGLRERAHHVYSKLPDVTISLLPYSEKIDVKFLCITHPMIVHISYSLLPRVPIITSIHNVYLFHFLHAYTTVVHVVLEFG